MEENIIEEIETTFAKFWENYGSAILAMGRKIITVILIIIAGKIIITISHRVTDRVLAGKTKIKADATLASVLRMVFRYAVMIICLIMILDTFCISTASLIALLGAAGVAIGFALRDTLKNIATGIVIIVLRPFNRGDFIECGPVSGIVREIGLFASNMETGDGIFISVPNSCLWGLPLRNFSRSSRRRMSITFNIHNTDFLQNAIQIIKDEIAQEPLLLKDPVPQITVQSMDESAIVISLKDWSRENLYDTVYNKQRKNIQEKLREAEMNLNIKEHGVLIAQDDQKIPV